MQHVRATGEKQAHVIGQKTVIGGAITGQVVFDPLDIVLVLTPRAVEILVQYFWGGAIQSSHDETGIVSTAHDFGLENHAKRLGPGRGGVVEFMIHPGAVGRTGRCV